MTDPVKNQNTPQPATSTEQRSAEQDPTMEKSVELEEFQPFPKLCAELRVKIWRLALPDARVVEVRLPDKLFIMVGGQKFWMTKQLNAYKPCALHYVSKEARDEYLRFYMKIVPASNFPATVTDNLRPIAVSAAWYFDPEVDILRLSRVKGSLADLAVTPTLLDVLRPLLRKIRFLSLDTSTNDFLKPLQEIASLESLETITMMANLYVDALPDANGNEVHWPNITRYVTRGDVDISRVVDGKVTKTAKYTNKYPGAHGNYEERLVVDAHRFLAPDSPISSPGKLL